MLTPAPAHYDLVKKALTAGKHVYTEKPIATDLPQARELIALAREKGLYLGSAPDTFLGSGIQTARAALDAGRIGDVTSFHVVANRDLSMLAGLFKFLRLPGGGIAYDYGVYYLTVLCALLGPVESVFARVSNFARVRKNMIPGDPEFGQDYIYDNESQVHAVLTTRSGIPGTFSLNGDSAGADQAAFTIHGTKGILRLGDANQFGPQIAFLPEQLSRSPNGKRSNPSRPFRATTEASAWPIWPDASVKADRPWLPGKWPAMCWTWWRRSSKAERPVRSGPWKQTASGRGPLTTGKS